MLILLLCKLHFYYEYLLLIYIVYSKLKYIECCNLMILRVNRDYGQFFVIGQFLFERLLLSRVVLCDTYLRQPYRDPGILIRSVCGTVTGLSETFL